MAEGVHARTASRDGGREGASHARSASRDGAGLPPARSLHRNLHSRTFSNVSDLFLHDRSTYHSWFLRKSSFWIAYLSSVAGLYLVLCVCSMTGEDIGFN